MKKVAIFAFITIFTLGFFVIPSYAQDMSEAPDYRSTQKGDAMLFDLILLRPLGLASVGIGFAATIISFPFAVMGGNTREVGDALLGEPMRYTFVRPMGEIFPKRLLPDY